MSGLFSAIFGSSTDSSDGLENPRDIIETYCDRIRGSKLVEDKLKSLQQLNIGARSYPFDVASLALNTLSNELVTSHDEECILLTLEILLTLFSNHADRKEFLKHDILVQFVEMFVSKRPNVDAVVCGLENSEFKIKFKCIQLLSSLVVNSPQSSIFALIQNPVSMSVLMGLLSDVREVIRNEALTLLGLLTHTSGGYRSHICRLVVFQNGFDALIDTVKNEGGIVGGGVVVQDCIAICADLLTVNVDEIALKAVDSSIRNIFLESKCINSLAELFPLPATDDPLTDQSIRNLIQTLRLLNAFVCERCIGYDSDIVTKSQMAVFESGFLEKIFDWVELVDETNSAGEQLIPECLFTVSRLCRRCVPVQSQVLTRLNSRLIDFLVAKHSIHLKLNAYRCLQSLCEEEFLPKIRESLDLIDWKTMIDEEVRSVNSVRQTNPNNSFTVGLIIALVRRCVIDEESRKDLIKRLFRLGLCPQANEQSRVSALCSLVQMFTTDPTISSAEANAPELIQSLTTTDNPPLVCSLIAFVLCLSAFYNPAQKSFLEPNREVIELIREQCKSECGQTLLALIAISTQCPPYIQAKTDRWSSQEHQPASLQPNETFIEPSFVRLHSQLLPSIVQRIAREFELNDAIANPFENECLDALKKARDECENMFNQGNEYFNLCQQYYAALCSANEQITKLTEQLAEK